MKLFIGLLVVMCLFGCKPNNYQPIIQHRKELLRITENTSLYTRYNSVCFEITNGDSIDEYFLKRDNLELEFVNHLKNHQNVTDELDTNMICKAALKRLNYIEKFQINGYTQRFKDSGVKVKFYLDDYEQILYIPYLDSLQGSYKDYVTKGKLLTKGWYLYKE